MTELEILRKLERQCRKWFAASDGSLKALEDETSAQFGMGDCLEKLDKLRDRKRARGRGKK